MGDIPYLTQQAREAFKRRREAHSDYFEALKIFNGTTDPASRSALEPRLNELKKIYNDAHNDYSRLESELNKERKNRALDMAGLTADERKNAKVVWQDDITTQIFYGGIDKADGEGHGHIVLMNDLVVYRRTPFSPHGSHNYISS